MKYIVILGFCLAMIMHPADAQVTRATLQASGLTCALCAKSIYTNLSALPFVDSVDTDLNASSFLIKFRSGAAVDPDLIRKKVEDAGFSVSMLQLELMLNKGFIENENLIKFNGRNYEIVGGKLGKSEGLVRVQVVEKSFLTAKDYKKLASTLKLDTAEPNNQFIRVRVIK
jgi:copper chaperone CopZ